MIGRDRMRNSSKVLALLLVLSFTMTGIARADSDHDAKQDKRLANANKGKFHDLNGGAKRKAGWGSGCQATGGEMSLLYPVPPHFKVDTFQLHVRWCVKNHKITRYSVWPDDDPWALWVHWDYQGIIAHVVHTYRDRVYARFTASYKICLSWLFAVCREHRPWIAITVYNRNKAPVEHGGWNE